MKWITEQRKITDLIPHETNPRKLSQEQAEQLEASLRRFDLAEIPAINTNNKILAGHQRLKALKALGRGDDIIDVRVPDRELTADEEREYLIRSNKNTGEWDMDMLLTEFGDEELIEWGWAEDELAALEMESINPGGEIDVDDLDDTCVLKFTMTAEQYEQTTEKLRDINDDPTTALLEALGI